MEGKITGFKLTRTEKAQTIVALIKTCIALIELILIHLEQKKPNNTDKART